MFSKKKTNKQRKAFKKRLVKDIKISLKKKTTKSANMLLNDIEISLKKKTKRSVNMVVNRITNFKRIKNKDKLTL